MNVLTAPITLSVRSSQPKGEIGLDIISEILETDRLAEDKLEQARQKRSQMLEECEKQTEQILTDARREAEEYRSGLMKKDDSESAETELKNSEKKQLAALAEAYEKNHEKWEEEIVAAITG